MTVIYFVRHGETDLNRRMCCQGIIDHPLNETGERQLEATAAEFDSIHIDRIYSSPLLRARQSAAKIAARKRMEVEMIDAFVEIDHGVLEGKDREESDKMYPGMFGDWIERPHTVKFPGGESLEDVKKRALRGLAEILKADSGRSALLLSHQVAIGVVRCRLEGTAHSDIWKDKLAPGGVYRAEIDAETEKLIMDENEAARN